MTDEELRQAALQQLRKELFAGSGSMYTGGSSREAASQWAMIALALRDST